MRGKRLLALLLCMAMAFQVVPCASAEEQARNTAEPPDFSVYAPGEIDIIVDKDGKAAISPKDPAIYNGVETKAVEVTNVQIAARDGWTLVPFEETFEENTAQMIGVRLNGADIDANGILDLSGQSWVIEAGGKLPLDFNVRLPESLPKKDVPGVLTITYTFDWAEEDNIRTLTPVDGEHGTIDDKTPVKTDKYGVVPDKLPNVTPEEGYEFEKWVDENGNEVKPGDVLEGDTTIKPVFQVREPETTFSVDYDNGLMLPESNNTATFKWSNAPDDFELAGITSSDPSVAEVSEVFDSANESQQVEVIALKRGVAKFTGVSTTGETATFDVQVSELNGDSRPTASIDKVDEVKPGDTIDPDDITVEIPTVTPDGETDTVTVTPDDVSGGEINEGKNVVSATVDANGVNITINIVINITINQGTPVDPSDHTHAITINPDGGDGHADNSSPLKTDENGKVPELPSVMPNEGYVFDKWTDEAGSEVKPGDTIDDDAIITPTFKPDENYKVYTITIEPGDHGRADDDTTLKTDVNGKVPLLPTVTSDEGYVFDKWVDEGVSEVKPGNILDRDVTITPTFKQDNTHRLTPVDGDHGIVVDKTPIQTDTNGVVQDNFPNVTSESGYKVERWVYVDSSDTVKTGDVLTKDVEIKPVFSKDSTHILTPVDGDHGTVPDKTPIQTDKRGRVQDNLPKVISENGYKFEKWVDENGDELVPGTLLENDITITPIFSLKKTYTVGFRYCSADYALRAPFEIVVDDGSILEFKEGCKYPGYIQDDLLFTAEGDFTFKIKVEESQNSEHFNYINYVRAQMYDTNGPKIPTIGMKFNSSTGISKYLTGLDNRGSSRITEFTYTIDADLIESGDEIHIIIDADYIFYSMAGLDKSYWLTFVNVEHGTIVNKDRVKTGNYGIVLDNLPEVIPDEGYEFVTWVNRYLPNNEIKPGYMIDEDMFLMPIYKPAEPNDVYTLTPIDGNHGTIPEKTPITTDKHGIVPDNLPEVIPDSGYGFEKWVDADSGEEIAPGDRLTKDVTIKPVFAVDNTHTLTPIDGEHCTVADKTPIETDVNGVVQNHFPDVTHEEAYKVEKWIYVDSGEIVTPGDVLTKDVNIKPVLTVDNGPYTIYFQTANYYDLSDTTPLTTIEGRRIPMNQMPEVSPIVSHFFDGVWVNVDTNEVVDAETRLKSDITVKPQINCLFTERNGAVTGFSDYAQDKNVESITIPNNIMGRTVTRIGEHAFSAHNNYRYENGFTYSDPNPKALEIKHVVIQEGIFALDEGAFGSANIFEQMNLESIQLPDGLRTIGESVFYECTKLTSIKIPDSVTRIGDAAFWYNTSLSSVSLGRSVQFLGYRAFMHCTALRSISLPSSLRTIDGACFEGSGLESVNVPDGCSVGNSAFIFCDNLKYATLGEGTTSLRLTFQRCPNLRSVRLPRSITSINPNAFYYCPNLAYIYIKGSRNSVSGAPWSSSQTNPTVIWTS